MIRISIIIPIYYGNGYIENIIRMVHKNSVELNKSKQKADIECIFVNDSPEVPLAIEAPFRTFDIRVITPKINKGIHGARVLGLRYAQGNLVLFLDQDDEISDRYLLEQLNAIGKSDMVVCNGIMYDSHQNKKVCYDNKAVQRMLLRKSYFYWVGCPIASPGQVLMKKDIIPKLWKRSIMKKSGADDYFLWLLLIKNRASIALNDKILYYHNYTGSNFSENKEKMMESEYQMLEQLRSNQVFGIAKYTFAKRRLKYKAWLSQNKYKRARFKSIYFDQYLVQKAVEIGFDLAYLKQR